MSLRLQESNREKGLVSPFFLAAGYLLPRLIGHDKRTARTIAIEVGMQNSGLGVALALKYFSTLSALPGSLFSLWHNISSALLAAWWARTDGDLS